MIKYSLRTGEKKQKYKPVKCPNCNHGRICDIPPWGQTQESQRGKPPPGQDYSSVIIKCPTCGTYVSLTIE